MILVISYRAVLRFLNVISSLDYFARRGGFLPSASMSVASKAIRGRNIVLANIVKAVNCNQHVPQL